MKENSLRILDSNVISDYQEFMKKRYPCFTSNGILILQQGNCIVCGKKKEEHLPYPTGAKYSE